MQFSLLDYVTCLVVLALIIYTLSGDLSDMVGVTERSIEGPHHAFYGDLRYYHQSILISSSAMILSISSLGAPVAQWVKHWPPDLADGFDPHSR